MFWIIYHTTLDIDISSEFKDDETSEKKNMNFLLTPARFSWIHHIYSTARAGCVCVYLCRNKRNILIKTNNVPKLSELMNF